VEDLSHLASSSLAVSSMAGGNRQSSNAEADTAPGSSPVDPELPSGKQSDPTIDMAPDSRVDRHLESGDPAPALSDRGISNSSKGWSTPRSPAG
jgi:hypothetical protein